MKEGGGRDRDRERARDSESERLRDIERERKRQREREGKRVSGFGPEVVLWGGGCSGHSSPSTTTCGSLRVSKVDGFVPRTQGVNLSMVLNLSIFLNKHLHLGRDFSVPGTKRSRTDAPSTRQALVAPKPSQVVLLRGHAGLVISKLNRMFGLGSLWWPDSSPPTTICFWGYAQHIHTFIYIHIYIYVCIYMYL